MPAADIIKIITNKGGMQLTYRREDLVESYLRKYRELGRPPTVKEINQDPKMASYWSYYRHIGLKDEICQQLNISNIPSSIYHLFCADCVFDRSSCNKNPFECAR